MKDKCVKCKHKIRRGWEYPCSICGDVSNGEESMFEPKTNADRIRSMTDEELAEFIFSQVKAKCNNHDCVGADTCYYHADWNSGECDGCDRAILKWLQKECEV